MQNLKKLFIISRPVSWLNTAYPFAAGYLVSGGAIDVIFVVGTLYFLGPYNLLMYGVNDVFDYESDIRNPRKGGIEGAVTSKTFHPVILWAALVSNIPFIALLVLMGTPASALTLAVVLFFVIAYSIAKLRFKERPFLDSISSSIHFVGPLVFALALTGSVAASAPYVVAFFLWGMASHSFGAVQDIIPDRAGGLSSIATYLGAQKTVLFALALYAASVTVIALQGMPALIVALAGSTYVFNITRYTRVTDQISATTRLGWRRFIWLNYLVGFIITLVLILSNLPTAN